MSAIPLIILSEVASCAYGTLIPFILYFEGVCKTTGVFS